MKPRQIEAFRAVIETGSVTAAADRLRISQPAVSKLIMQLEDATRLALFVRDRQRLVPTPEARLLFEEIDRVFLGVDRIERFAEDLREKRAGRMRIGCLPGLGLSLVPDVVASFAAERPDVHMTLHVQTSAKIADWVLGQQVDLGISLLRVDHPSVDAEPLTRADAVCILPAGHKLSKKAIIAPEDLRNVPFIGLGREDHTEQMISRVFDYEGVQRHVRLETNLSAVACHLVATGAGVSIVDPFTAAEFRSAGIVVRPFHPTVSFNMWLLYPNLQPRSKLIETFVDALRREVAQRGVK
jgi:DNA-binding transcriptional LysR family regulator